MLLGSGGGIGGGGAVFPFLFLRLLIGQLPGFLLFRLSLFSHFPGLALGLLFPGLLFFFLLSFLLFGLSGLQFCLAFFLQLLRL